MKKLAIALISISIMTLMSCKKDEVKPTIDFEIYSYSKILSYQIESDSKLVLNNPSPIGTEISLNGYRYFYKGSYNENDVNKDKIIIKTSSTKNGKIKFLVKNKTYNTEDFSGTDFIYTLIF